MDFIKDIINKTNSSEEFLREIFLNYILFRKKFLIEEIESATFFLLKEYFDFDPNSCNKWSSSHCFLDKISKGEMFDKKAIFRKAMITHFGEEDALSYVDSAMIQIAEYRMAVKKAVDNDIRFLMSHFAVYSSLDYERFSILEDILLEE